MDAGTPTRSYKKLMLAAGLLMAVLFTAILVAVQVFVEPTLRKKLEVLVVQGSDSLYRFQLGDLNANFFGGNIEVQNLQIRIDSGRYASLKARKALPSLTMELQLDRAQIRGLGVFSFLFGKKVKIDEIFSRKANIRLFRHPVQSDEMKAPLWKSIQPYIAGITVRHIRLDGIKLLYRHADTSYSGKLQFDSFDARLDDIRIDSAGTYDTARLGFTRDLFLRFHDLKYRSEDSTYKLKAEWITYSSRKGLLEIDSFKLQPTLSKDAFYEAWQVRKSLYYLDFNKIRLTRFSLRKLLLEDAFLADSMILTQPTLSIYLDKSFDKRITSKIGRYPHQVLMKSAHTISIGHIVMRKAKLDYTERHKDTRREGVLALTDLDLHIQNATNDSAALRKNARCIATADGRILGAPIQTRFTFYLDSLNGRFDVKGMVQGLSAQKLNTVSVPLANLYLPTLQLEQLQFAIRADDYNAWADVDMRYNNLSLELRKWDGERGAVTKRSFLNKLVNRYVINPGNPGPEGLRRAANVRHLRLTTQTFFGVIWKSLFAGMQQVMLKTGTVG